MKNTIALQNRTGILSILHALLKIFIEGLFL